MNQNGLTTVSGAVEYLDLSRTRVYQLMNEGHLPYVKLPGLNGRRRIKWADLKSLVARLRTKK